MHSCGIYAIKESYIKQGEQRLNEFHVPVHIVEYYRYFRFYPEGIVLTCMQIKKLKKQEIVDKFDIEVQAAVQLKEEKTMVGVFQVVNSGVTMAFV